MNEGPNSIPTHDDLTMQHTLHLHSVISKITPYSGSANPFNPMKLFTHSQNPGAFFGLRTGICCWLPSSLLEASFRWV
jgi:hypothetical protein